MGTYATTTSLQTRLINTSFDTATAALATEMITDAESEVNKYLARRYDLTGATFQTSTSIPPLVRQMATRLAEGYMWKAMSRGSKESLSRGKELIDGVMKNLADLSEYKGELLMTSGALVPDMSNTAYRVLSNTKNYSPTFNEDKPTSWRVDGDKLDDIATERES